MLSIPFILQSVNIDGIVLLRSKAPLHVAKCMNYSWLFLLGLFHLLLHNKSCNCIKDDGKMILIHKNYLMPGAFCMISSLIVLLNFIFALNLSALSSRYLFLIRTIHVVKRFKGVGAT